MGNKLGNARRARKLAKLLQEWRQAFDAQDAVAMAVTKRAIDAVAKGDAASLTRRCRRGQAQRRPDTEHAN